MRSQIANILRESSQAIMKITIKERSSNIALNQPNLKSVDQIKDFSAADKDKVREILAKNLEDGKGARASAKDLEAAFKDVDKKRAEAIARTGHNEMNSLAQRQRYKDKGFQSFTIIMADPCPDCIETYDNVVFSIDDTEMLPPLHTHCMCTPEFHEETPEEYAEKYGYDVYDGSVGGDEGESEVDIPELQDLQETIDYVNNLTNDQLSSILDDALTSVLGTGGVDEMVVSDVVDSMGSFLDDPVTMLEREPLKANILLELLRRLKIIV